MAKKSKADREELKQIIGQAQPRGRVGDNWVFQKCAEIFSNCRDINRPKLMIRRLVIPNDPKTPGQIAQRELFKQGIAAWKMLTPAQKAEYKARAKKRKLPSGYVLFMRDYLNSAAPQGVKRQN